MDISTKRDVIVVGAGAAGLTAALHLSKQNLKVTVIDGAVHPGAENWSGCVFFGENLAHEEILGPEWIQETAIERKLVTRGIYMTNGVDAGGVSFNDPETFKNCATVLRPVFDHDLSEIARSRGVEILSRTTALGLIREDDKVIGVATEKGPIYSDLVFLAEGDAAHLVSREGYSNLPSGDKGHYLQGIKEVIHLKPEVIEKRFDVKPGEGAAYEMLIRNARIGGKTVQLNMGAFIYTNRESLSIGLVLPLDNLAEHFKGDHNNLMEWFKAMPIVKHWTEGGHRTAYGAKIINANGYKHLSRLCDNGLAIGGACTGIGLDFPYPNYTGPASFTGLCLGQAVKAIKEEGADFSQESLEKHYEKSIKQSQYYKDMATTQNWADYISSSKSFFSLFCDVKLDCSHPFFDGKGFFSSFKDSCRSFFYHSSNGKLTTLIKDLIRQQKCAGAGTVGPFGILGAYFSGSPLPLPPKDQGNLSIKFYQGEKEVTSQMNSALKSYTNMADPVLRGAFNILYRNTGEALSDKFKSLNHVIAKRGFLLLLLAMIVSPFIILLAGINGLLDVFANKKKIMQSPTAKRIMAARKAQELSSFSAESSVEDKLASIVYETEETCHIKVHWPRKTYLPESDPNSALWHVCPAGVYHAEKDPAGMLRPVVDYENCVKCESCWRGSPLADWGRRGNHRLIYRVKTSALTTLIRHQALKAESKAIEGERSNYNKPVESSEKQLNILSHINLLTERIHELIQSPGRILTASDREWIEKLAEEIDEEVNSLSTDFPDKRIASLVKNLEVSIERIKEFIEIERFFWVDAELQVMKQHTLTQLGVQDLTHDILIPESIANPANEAKERFTLAHLHEIKKNGLGNDDLNVIKDWLTKSTEENELQVVSELSKIDLSLTAIYLQCRIAQKITNSNKFITLAISNDLSIDDNSLKGSVPFALSAIANDYLVVSKEGAWIISSEAEGLNSNSIGAIGLRSGKPVELLLDGVSGEKIDFSGISQLIETGCDLFYESIIGAGEYLLDKSVEHATGRIQFPDLFQDEYGRDGIIKFGAVKALISHIACRLELLKAANDTDIPKVIKYVQAGKWLGTQEGSFTYNATQVFGGTGFSEDDTLSPYYRDASIFKYLLGDPYTLQLSSDLDLTYKENSFTENSLLEEPLEWLTKGLEADKTIDRNHKEIAFRAEMDYRFINAALNHFEKLEKSGASLLYFNQILELASKIYWNSALSRAHDSKMYDVRSKIGARLFEDDWKYLKPDGREFNYEKFLEDVEATPTGNFLTHPDFNAVRYSPENKLSDPELSEKAKELDSDFKSYFIDKDFDGMSYVRYAEKMHGHSDEVIKMFHDKGYMRLIIPSELGGGGCHKSIYYLLISASMQYGDPALSLIIQASTSIGTSPMLLAWKKDIPKAIKDVEGIDPEQLKKWISSCEELVKSLDNPDPKTIKNLFQGMADEVKALAGKNSVFKSQCAGFLYGLHKAGQAGMSFQLDVMGDELTKASKKLADFIPQIEMMNDEFTARKKGVGFFLSLIASGQTSAFALTEPSAGSDTARVATRATKKELELTREKNGSYSFKNDDGEQRILIDLEQTRFEDGSLQIRLKEEDDWSPVCYDKYSWEDDTGYRYILLDGEEFVFHEFGRVHKDSDKFTYRYYELTGSKMWITNGRFAGLFALYAKTKEGITGLCVDRYAEGLTIGKDEDKMGQNASPTNEVFLEKVRVCTSFVLGLEGRGQVNALETLNVGRAGLSLSSLALTEDMIEAAVKFSDNSKKDHPLLGQMMEEMSGAFPASYEMIGIFDKPGSDARMESAIGKFMNSEILHRAILYSEGIHGPHSQTYNHDVEKKKRDARILNIYEGTNEIQRFLILKDLVEQLSKVDYSPVKSPEDSPELKQWDQYRILLLDMVKKVKKDLGSKAWMDSQLQPLFFYLAEVAGWLKFTDGALWRKMDLKSESKHVIFDSLDAAIQRGLFEIDRKFRLFDAAYGQLARGVRPAEIVIPGLLLNQLEMEEEQNELILDSSKPAVKIQAFLAVRPLNKPETEIIDGKNVDGTTTLTQGSLNLLQRIQSLPKNCEVEIVCAAPESAEGLIKHLSSAGNVTWLNTGYSWPGAEVCAIKWKEVAKKDFLLLFDGSSPNWLGAAYFVTSSVDKNPAIASEFSIQEKEIIVLSENKHKNEKHDGAIVISQSFKAPHIKAQRESGKITVIKSDDFQYSEAQLPPEPPQVESADINSPESAAGYLSKELGIEAPEHTFKLKETEVKISSVCLIGNIKGGELTRDTVLSLANLSQTYNELTLILPGTEGLKGEILNKCTTLPKNSIFVDFPEAWLVNPSLTSKSLSASVDLSDKVVLFVPSRAADAGILANQNKSSFFTGISRIKSSGEKQSVWTEQAEQTVLVKSETSGCFVGIMSSNPDNSSETAVNEEGSFMRLKAEDVSGFEHIKQSLMESAGQLGIESISEAEFILDIGYGIGNQDNYDEFVKPLENTFKELGVKVTIGASRKLVETLKILPAETQIGQSGSSVTPKILIAVGISGAPQHINYIGKNTVILCFNIDSQAPLMILNESKPFPKVYPVAGDLKKTLPALQKALESLLQSSTAA